VLDRGSFFEMGPKHGASVVTGLARLSGRPIGILAHDPKFYGGAVTAAAADKMVRFIDTCDTFHLPVVYFVDNPGFMIGVEAEKEATIRFGARYIFAVYQATVPGVPSSCGGSSECRAAHGNHSRLNLRYAWPSGDWGSFAIEGAFKRPTGARSKLRKTRRLCGRRSRNAYQVASPFRTAEMFGVEEIIDRGNPGRCSANGSKAPTDCSQPVGRKGEGCGVKPQVASRKAQGTRCKA